MTQAPGPGPRRMAGIADDYARELDRLGERAEANTITLLRTSLANVLRDLRRSYAQYLETLGPLEQDPAGNPIRRPGAYTAGESAVKFRAILRDASGFLNDTELQAWQAQFEQDLRQATELGGRIGQDLSELVLRPDDVVPFTGADPLVVRTAAAISGAYIQGESARFRDQIVQIVGEGASRGWGPKRLELGIREALEGADDPNGITQRMGLKQRAALIARSELANAYVRATIERSQRQGFGYVRVLASNDERVCPICASRNGRVYPADRISLPWHPRCRCVAVAVVNEAVEETDPESREVLLDNDRWRKEHDRGVEVYARGRHKQKIETLRRQVERAKDGDRKDQLSAQLDRLIERGPDIVKARTELAQALKTPTASEKRLFGKDAKPLQESVPLQPPQ